ncbi:MAG: HAMP domain-containing histidine kinase [Lachnospiraceae bacterium]|nr:HAMP domain-containing histidine kinase [Lachnospiraceae bacterium]
MKKLRRKMIRTVFLSAISVFALLMIVIYTSISYYFSHHSDTMTALIAANNNEAPDYQEYSSMKEDTAYSFFFRYDPETYTRTRFFTVILDKDSNFVRWAHSKIASTSIAEKDAVKLASKVIKKDRKTGYIDTYRYRITWNGSEGTYSIIFLNCSDDLLIKNIIVLFSMFAAIILTLLTTIIFTLFSNHFMKPFVENSHRQKQFITDASHELKTPLSIISANAQVLEFKTGENEWLQNIIHQTTRMTNLINELTTLSKMEEVSDDLVLETLNFSQITVDTLSPFQELIEEHNATLQLSIQNDIYVNGNKEQITRLVSILGENASKYVKSGGTVIATLTANRKNLILRIFNTADLPSDFNPNRLFDRFYRPDSSRTSATGGHGIGLSIAKKIVTTMGGTIETKKEKDGITFVAFIPRIKKDRHDSWSV